MKRVITNNKSCLDCFCNCSWFWSEKENKQTRKKIHEIPKEKIKGMIFQSPVSTFNSRQPWGKLQGQDLFESTTTRFPRQNVLEWMEINRNSLPFEILVPKPKILTLDHQIQKKKVPPIQPNLKLTSQFLPFPTNIRLPRCGKPYPATRVTVPGATVVVALSVAAARPLNPGLPDLVVVVVVVVVVVGGGGGGGGGGGNFITFHRDLHHHQPKKICRR